MTILEEFAKERKYNLEKLKEYGWSDDGINIFIKHTSDYSVRRAYNGITYKPKDKKTIRYFILGSSDKLVIVEGHTDAVAIKHIDETLNVLAICGVKSFRLLERLKYCYQGSKIIFAYDQDDAGKKCTEDSIELLLNCPEYKKLDMRVLKWNPDIKDVDEYYRKYGEDKTFLCLDRFKIPGEKVGYTGDFIEELKALTNQQIIVGKKICCLSPEHKDNTPSMHIYDNHAYCYTCGYNIRPKRQRSKKKDSVAASGFSKAIGHFINFSDMSEKFIKQQPLFYDKALLWWLWSNERSCYEIVDETDLMILIDEAITYTDTTKSNIKNEILESLKRVGRKNIPKEAPSRWVQFKDKAISLRSKNIYKVTPDYFFTNPIPWKIGESPETPVMDKIFKEWVGEKYVKTLYEIIAYCCLTDYPISRLFCLIGVGRNGKTKFLNLIEKLIGENNKCSTELDDLLESRFEKAKLYRKLICLMGETNFKLLEKTSILKKLCGGDLIGFEFKNKMPFDARNYAKIIISTNSLPATTDKTDGFYRRWMIIDFANQFSEEKDILLDIPEQEYNNLCKKITEILPNLTRDRKFTNEGTYEERMRRYEEKSNPLSLFIKENCHVHVNAQVPFFEFFDEYLPFLIQRGFRKQSKPEVSKLLANEGYDTEQKSVDGKSWKWILGLEITQITQITHTPLKSYTGELGGNTVISVITIILSINDLYHNHIPIYKIVEECKKVGYTCDVDEELSKLKERGDVMELTPGFISITK